MVSSVPVILPPPPQHRSVPRFFSTFTPFPPFSCALFFFILGTRAVRFPSIRVESTSGRNYNKGRRCYNNDIGIARAERIWKFSNEYRPSDNCLHRDDSYIFLCFSLPFFSFFSFHRASLPFVETLFRARGKTSRKCISRVDHPLLGKERFYDTRVEIDGGR